MIRFKEIDEGNFRAVVNMKMPEGQRFVAPNAVSLAQAWLFRNKAGVHPYALYDDGDVLVGFLMVDDDPEERTFFIWRLMIALEHQNKGYGTEAIKKALDMARESGKYDRAALDYVPENKVAEHVYKKLGFLPTGEIDDGEIVMRLDF